MDEDILQAILGSYTKILAEISEIKQVIQSRLPTPEVTVNKNKELIEREVRRLECQAREQKSVRCATPDPPNQWSASMAKPKRPVMPTTALSSTQAAKKKEFDPTKGFELEKFYSQRTERDVKLDFKPSLNFRKKASVQETHSVGNDTGMSLAFFNVLEKEIEEAL